MIFRNFKNQENKKLGLGSAADCAMSSAVFTGMSKAPLIFWLHNKTRTGGSSIASANFLVFFDCIGQFIGGLFDRQAQML